MSTNRISYPYKNSAVKYHNRPATIHLVQSSRFARRFAKLLLAGLILSILAMMFLPWQQTSRGIGEVIALDPQERQQTIEAPAKGVISKVYDGLMDGSPVKKGQLILEIQPFAANMVQQLNGQISLLNAKLETANAKAEAHGQNINGFTEARDYAVTSATELVSAAQGKLDSTLKKVDGEKAKVWQAKLNYERQKGLFEQGLKPEKEVEKLKKEWDVAKANLAAIYDDVKALEDEVQAKEAEREEKRQVAQTKIDYARAMQQDAFGTAATIRKEIADLDIKLEEMERLKIRAPRDGTIYRMPVYEQNQTVKEGEPLLTIIPETTQMAVELLVSGNDMPLVQIGQEVRLQFEGWPAVQFAGWPSVAVGTFSGLVNTVDATDNGMGKFRILITPNPDQPEWPTGRYLRQGVRTNGWVLMRQVSLGYEIWRQLNGFPIIVADDEPTEGYRTPKLPK